MTRGSKHAADELGSSPGRIVLHVKTAHVYEPELELMQSLTSSATPGA